MSLLLTTVIHDCIRQFQLLMVVCIR